MGERGLLFSALLVSLALPLPLLLLLLGDAPSAVAARRHHRRGDAAFTYHVADAKDHEAEYAGCRAMARVSADGDRFLSRAKKTMVRLAPGQEPLRVVQCAAADEKARCAVASECGTLYRWQKAKVLSDEQPDAGDALSAAATALGAATEDRVLTPVDCTCLVNLVGHPSRHTLSDGSDVPEMILYDD